MGWTDHYDCELWIDYILMQTPEAQIVLHGQSMGAATALIMAGSPEVSGQIMAVVPTAPTRKPMRCLAIK